MCGIAGYMYLKDSEHIIDQQILVAMNKVLAHRGPNGKGVWSSNQHGIGLAHVRLSIVDLSDAGLQPMMDPQKTVVVSFNGEIYNHQELRLELEARGYVYRSRTDTETLIYAYKEWGIDFLNKLEGMFAFALFDLRTDELFLVRDRFGVKPLYIALQEGMLSFASEIKALWRLPWMRKQINQQAFYHYLTFMVTPAPLTLYQKVYKIPAGFYMHVKSDRSFSFHEWYNPWLHMQLGHEVVQSEATYIENLRLLLRASIKKRMMADVPVGVFLSGGIDSSLNTALMSEHSGRVKTFNVVFSDHPENDERVWARKVSAYFGTDHHEIVISEKEAFESFKKVVYHQDEPIADAVCIPLYHVAKLARDNGIVVVQLGEGSDEIFCGYPWYRTYLSLHQGMWGMSQKYIPMFLKKGLHGFAAYMFPQKRERLSQLAEWANNRYVFWGGSLAFAEWNKQPFVYMHPQQEDPIVAAIYPGMQQMLDSYSIVSYHIDRFKSMQPEAHFFDAMVYLELKQRLPELLLMRVDKMTMATSVEGREPFLDHHFVEYAMRIPLAYKYKEGQTKYILKKVCEGILPHDVIYRKKMGFGAPTSRWFARGAYFQPYIRELVLARQEQLKDLFDGNIVNRLLADHIDRGYESGVLLWTLQNVLQALE